MLSRHLPSGCLGKTYMVGWKIVVIIKKFLKFKGKTIESKGFEGLFRNQDFGGKIWILITMRRILRSYRRKISKGLQDIWKKDSKSKELRKGRS